MLGESVREARLRKNLTQARLARLAGVSRRHLAALEKGANVSINILQRVAGVLELSEIQLGGTALRPAADRGVNVPLLTDAIREARIEAERAQATLARAESLLGVAPETFSTSFPKLPVLFPDKRAAAGGEMVRDAPEVVEIETAGEIRHGQPIDESKKERVSLPPSLIEDGELVFRARGSSLREHGIEDGDLLVVELRPRGRAASGELVIGRIGDTVFVGRWWDKRGRKALMTNGLAEVTTGGSARALKIVAAINQIVRL